MRAEIITAERLRDAVAEGLDTYAVAALYRVTPGTVRQSALRHGIAIRTREEPEQLRRANAARRK